MSESPVGALHREGGPLGGFAQPLRTWPEMGRLQVLPHWRHRGHAGLVLNHSGKLAVSPEWSSPSSCWKSSSLPSCIGVDK